MSIPINWVFYVHWKWCYLGGSWFPVSLRLGTQFLCCKVASPHQLWVRLCIFVLQWMVITNHVGVCDFFPRGTSEFFTNLIAFLLWTLSRIPWEILPNLFSMDVHHVVAMGPCSNLSRVSIFHDHCRCGWFFIGKKCWVSLLELWVVLDGVLD